MELQYIIYTNEYIKIKYIFIKDFLKLLRGLSCCEHGL